MTIRKHILTVAMLLCLATIGRAQGFFNLTAEQVKIDSLLPCFTHVHDIGRAYSDSTYTVAIEYPEFIDMTEADILRYHSITNDTLPALPVVHSVLGVVRKYGQLDISFVPLVFRDGKFKKLVSFKLTVKGHALPRRARSVAKSSAASVRYADHSVLANGSWAKIRVEGSGIYQITETLAKQAGFSDLSKVKVYGYGGALQPETLTEDYLTSTDDLKEVPTYTVNGKRLFHAQGSVKWTSNTIRERNPYSDYGYYFLTESDESPATVDRDTFVSSFYPSTDDYNSLYEVDDYAWYHTGRNLYDAKTLGIGVGNDYTINSTGTSASGTVRVVLTANSASSVSVCLNDSVLGTINIASPASADYDRARASERSFVVSNLLQTNKVTLTQASGGDVRLDHIVIHNNEPKPAPSFDTEDYPVPEYVYRITPQDHHADTPVDMVIVIPTTQVFVDQAERLKTLHEQRDGMSVRIVPADELFNEFSSGTPDATAYRRYMKMLYDRAETDADMPRFLLLFGDGAWDNRMLSSEWRGYSPDDFLLCYESENSFSAVDGFVTDDFYGYLDDGETVNTGTNYAAKLDVAVGRLSARTKEQATAMVDKIEAYMTNTVAGSWKNDVVVMGDDGNDNVHMSAADKVADIVEQQQPLLNVKRIMWDAYPRSSSSTGFTYPDVTKLIKQYMTNGALLLNYNGHGKATTLSHETVLTVKDFQDNVSKALPVWVTASCDIMPFDGQETNIGEEAMYNKDGGAVAFLGTTRTVYTNLNARMNNLFTKYLFSSANGKPIPIGEALRLAKVELVSPTVDVKTDIRDFSKNKLHYVLMGDPAMPLAYPQKGVVVDSIGGTDAAASRIVTLKAGSKVDVVGHVATTDGQTDGDFNGILTAKIYDVKKKVECRLNDTSEESGAQTPFAFYDRPDMLYSGSDSVRNGYFKFCFIVPKDISYSQDSGRMLLYAINSDNTKEYNGGTEDFSLNGSMEFKNDSLGPNVYCYLNSSTFVNGGNVNTTPYFFAEINDEDGINAAGNGIGHDMQLTIDNDPSKTYILNDYFSFDFGSYQSGTVGYSLPALTQGQHKLLFRVWDVMNNSSTSELTFNVIDGAIPEIVDVGCTNNPATTSTTFRIYHDRQGSDIDVVIDVFDTSGRLLWSHTESGVSAGNIVSVDWDLVSSNGHRLSTGVYLYRIHVVSDGSSSDSKTKKLIILSNK